MMQGTQKLTGSDRLLCNSEATYVVFVLFALQHFGSEVSFTGVKEKGVVMGFSLLSHSLSRFASKILRFVFRRRTAWWQIHRDRCHRWNGLLCEVRWKSEGHWVATVTYCRKLTQWIMCLHCEISRGVMMTEEIVWWNEDVFYESSLSWHHVKRWVLSTTSQNRYGAE